jgi:hypothetical protein
MPKIVDCELVCDSEGDFELLFNPEQADIDSAMLMFMAFEATEMILNDCEMKNEIVDVTQIISGFKPRLFDMDVGDIFDCSLLKNGLMIHLLSDSGVFTASNSVAMLKEQTSEFEPSPMKAF